MFVYARRTGLIIQYATRAGSSGEIITKLVCFPLDKRQPIARPDARKKPSVLESVMTIDVFPLILTEIRCTLRESRFSIVQHYRDHQPFSLALHHNFRTMPLSHGILAKVALSLEFREKLFGHTHKIKSFE